MIVGTMGVTDTMDAIDTMAVAQTVTETENTTIIPRAETEIAVAMNAMIATMTDMTEGGKNLIRWG
jgi:hypothetical protein